MQEELQSPISDIEAVGDGLSDGTQVEETVPEVQRKCRHSDHSVSRKYRMFSNHCSANDMPHTRTSF